MTDQDFNIDSATGLPELPEGYMWTVHPDKDNQPMVSLCKVETIWIGHKVPTRDKYESYYGRALPDGKPVGVFTGNSREETHKEPHSNDFLSEIGIKKNVTRTYYENMFFEPEEQELSISSGDAWRPELILETSFNVLEQWLASRERAQRIEKLSGHYPPNKLVLPEEAE